MFGLGLNSVLLKIGLGSDAVLLGLGLGPVLVSVHSCCGHDVVSFLVVLTTTQIPHKSL